MNPDTYIQLGIELAATVLEERAAHWDQEKKNCNHPCTLCNLAADRAAEMRKATEQVRKSALRWRHVKRGTDYQVVAVASMQGSSVEGDSITIYIGDDGKIWARPTKEFHDGRFTQEA